ncbi:uracil phosphoribosyltransferase [bacterium]|nr:uracil phosphoribosyltransferase [bacterium]
MPVTQIDHPLIAHKIAQLRDESTGIRGFRGLLHEISNLLTFKATEDLVMKQVGVKTPITKAKMDVLADKHIVVVSILRAGIAMLPGVLSLFGEARIGLLGMKRDEETLRPNIYYTNLPEIQGKNVIIVDPMLATGGTMIAAVNMLIEKNPLTLRAVSVIASPEGATAFEKRFPSVPLYVGSIDEKLNDKGYIVPGLGDAGDRYFGTE